MSSSTYTALTRKEINELLIKDGDLSKIAGRPTCHSLINLIQELSDRVQQIPCPYSSYGYLFLVLPGSTYTSITGETITPPTQPAEVPAVSDLLSDLENDNIKILWAKARAQWIEMQNVNQELIAVAKTAFDASFKRTFTNLVGVAPTQIFLTWFNSLFDAYGQPNPDDITHNNSRMVADWNPATRDFASVIRQIEDATIFAGFIGQPKQDHENVYAGELVIRNAGFFAAKLENWYKKSQSDRTWANFKIFFSEEIAAWYRAGCTTGSQAGYGGNAEATDDGSYAEAEQQYIESLRNFSETNASNARAFDTMANSMMAAINEIKGQLQGMHANAAQTQPAPAPAPPAPPAPPTQLVYQAAPPPPTYTYAPPAPPNLPYQPPTPQYQPYQGYQQQGGRNGGRGRGRGRGRGYGRGNYQNQGRGGYHAQPQQQQYQQQQSGFYANQRPPNNQKYYANWNYCWTHGYDVADNHHSGNCQRPAYGHVYTATRDNPCSGCQKGVHKNQFPTNM